MECPVVCFFTGKEPESQNKCDYPVKGKAIKEAESDHKHAESKSNYYYSKYAKGLTGEELEEIFRSALIQQGNVVYVTILGKNQVRIKNNLLVSSVVRLITDWNT